MDGGLGIGLLLCIVCFGGLLALAGLVFLLVKLGVIASYWGKPAPADSGNQTLAQSREAGVPAPPATTTQDEPAETDTDSGQNI